MWQYPNPVKNCSVQNRVACNTVYRLPALLASVYQGGYIMKNKLKLDIPKTIVFLRDRFCVSSAGLSEAIWLYWGEEHCLWYQWQFTKPEALPSSWCAKWGKSYTFTVFVIFLYFFLDWNLILLLLNQSYIFTILQLCFWEFLNVLKVLL